LTINIQGNPSGDDNHAGPGQGSLFKKIIHKLRENIIKYYVPLLVSVIAMTFSILSVIYGLKALEAANLANKWAYYSYEQSLVANRLALMELCAMNVVSGRRLFSFSFSHYSPSLSAKALNAEFVK
jgi:hypothetical protein